MAFVLLIINSAGAIFNTTKNIYLISLQKTTIFFWTPTNCDDRLATCSSSRHLLLEHFFQNQNNFQKKQKIQEQFIRYTIKANKPVFTINKNIKPSINRTYPVRPLTFLQLHLQHESI